MGFIDLVKKEENKRKTLTENGAIAYDTSGKELLDFNFKLSGFRKNNIEDIKDEFEKVYFEDPMTAVKFLFWVGDIREGAGERKVFRSGLLWLAENKPEICKALIPLVAEYNRYDSLLPLLDTPLRKDVTSYYKEQLIKDARSYDRKDPVTLLAKWLPSEVATSQKTQRYARMICEDCGWSYENYRKALTTLRKYLDVVEVKMSANEWDKIDYSKVPSKANLIYSDAFLSHDEKRRKEYLESLKRGETKINAGVLQPHEIVAKYKGVFSWGVDDYDETLEQLWQNLPDETIENCLVVRDGSGSMTSKISGNTTCLDVATALTVYMAERNSGEWKNKFITFSSKPKVIDITNCESLHDKLTYINKFDECSNTDIYRTMMLILQTAVNNNVSQDDMPGMITICSDMQFDGRWFNLDKTLFENIIEEFEAAGYKMPKLIFWNINDRGECSIPIQQNDFGLILCSGFSVQIMKMFMSNKLDPYEVLMETINALRYDDVEAAVKKLIN